MLKRPKPGENEDDILQMQEEFLREKTKNNLQPAAQVVNLRSTTSLSSKGANVIVSDTRKPSKYAQSKGLKNHSEKRQRIDAGTSSIMGDILERNTEEMTQQNEMKVEDDKVYFPTIISSVLGNIVEKNVEDFVDFDFKPMSSQGFPVVAHRESIVTPGSDYIDIFNLNKKQGNTAAKMDVDEPSSSNFHKEHINLPSKSYILSSNEAEVIHNENVDILRKMSEKEILEEQLKLLSNLDPNLIDFIKSRRKQVSNDNQLIDNKVCVVKTEEKMDTTELTEDNDTLWENDVLSHPCVNKWLHFDSLEKDKLEWTKGIVESKKVKPDETYEARFDFKGYLLPYTMEYTEQTKILFHHGEEPNRPGYSLSELFELSRSTVTQQRVMALNTIAGVLEYYIAGTYKDIIDLPLSKIFFVIRIAMDENKIIILEPALKAMRNLLYNRIDEASLDALLGFEDGTQQPSLENDKSEIEELQTAESEFNDFHLAEIDIIAALLRTDILQRLFYILETVKPSFSSVQYVLQILIRLTRDSVETSQKIVDTDHLMHAIIKYFVPTTSISFPFDPQISYNGKPVLAALKLFRVLSAQSAEINNVLLSKYNILKPISEYVSSGVDSIYGLRIQIEAFCIMSNLLHYGVGIENTKSLFPVIVTTLYKHVKGTDIFVHSSVLSATHAAVVLQFINKLLNSTLINIDNYKIQIYPLLIEGVQKWLAQLSHLDSYTCGHLKLLCSALDCCKTVLSTENIPIKFLNDSLTSLASSRGFKEVLKNLITNSNLLSGVENRDLNLIKNLMSLGGSVIDSSQRVLPILNVTSPVPFLTSLLKLLEVLYNHKQISQTFINELSPYLSKLGKNELSLCDNWFTRIEINFVFITIKLSTQCDIPDPQKELLYTVAKRLCYILRSDQGSELEFLFNNIVFNKQWFTAERLMSLVSLSDADGIYPTSIEDIKLCYCKVVNFNCKDTKPNLMLKRWQVPILPRDWIYLPILNLYSRSQEMSGSVNKHVHEIEVQITAEKEFIIACSLEWIIFNELCFPDLLNDIPITDRFCRIMCVFLCDNSLFLNIKIKILLQKCTQILFKAEKKIPFDFDKQLIGLHNFQDFYTQFLEQFQSVSYGDHTFAASVLVPLAQKHNVKWRKLLWSEYAGCLRVLDCPEELLCYEIKDYFHPEETDESLIKCYFRALSSNLLTPNTIAYRIAEHHVQTFKTRSLNINRLNI